MSYDPAWEQAEKANESRFYYWAIKGRSKFVKLYKPSVAELMKKRTGVVLRRVK